MPSDIPQAVHGTEFQKTRHTLTMAVDCEHKEKMLHEGRRGEFVIYSDEPPGMGGDDNHPVPLAYVAWGVGF
jgi:hypothetical protein